MRWHLPQAAKNSASSGRWPKLDAFEGIPEGLSKPGRSRSASSAAVAEAQSPGSHARIGRPPRGKTLLSLQRLLKEALRILDEQGLDALSMRALAERLGVTPMSLYRYCKSHDALLDAVHDEILAAHPPRPVARDQSWREVMIEMARALRRAFAAHPNAAMLFATRPVRGQRCAPHVDAVLGRLVEAGFDLGIAVYLLDTISAFAIGHSLAEFGQSIATASRLERELSASTAPAYADKGLVHLSQLATFDRTHDYDAAFVVGLLAILDGFAHRYAKRNR
jgi:TetR/AcrR family transcriptional regulator, tetracycline repressor protein